MLGSASSVGLFRKGEGLEGLKLRGGVELFPVGGGELHGDRFEDDFDFVLEVFDGLEVGRESGSGRVRENQ